MKLESLDELRVFAQIVESGSLSAAARVLGMTVNTVSRRLAALEGRLGTVLLYRTTRSQSLSEAGRTLLARAHRILDEVAEAESALQEGRQALAGLVRVGLPSILTADFFAALQPLLAEHPELRVEASVQDRQVNPVAAGLDVVLIGGRWADSGLIARKVMDIELFLFASEGYLAANGEPTTPDELSAHPTLHFKMTAPASTWVLRDAAGAEHVVPVQARVAIDDGRGLIDAARAGLGVAMISRRAARLAPELKPVLPGYGGARFPIFAVYPASGRRSARLQAVVGALESALD
jgi:DNA-binding transcriptional LysR family regulator